MINDEFRTEVAEAINAFLDEHGENAKAVVRAGDGEAGNFLIPITKKYGETVTRLVQEGYRVRKLKERSPSEAAFDAANLRLKEVMIP